MKDVDGYYIIRPRVSYFSNFAGALHSDRLLTDVYAVEDPYGTFQDHDSNAANLTTALGSPEEKGYRFIEAPVLDLASIPYPEYYFAAGYRPSPPYVREERLFARHPNDPTTGHVPSLTRDVLIRQGGSGAYARYERVTTRMVDEGQKLLFQRHWKGNPDLSDHPYGREVFFYPAAETIVPTLKSQYGIVWRGISRPLDREMGIAGGEVLVLDLKTNEILGVHRGFALVGSDPVPFGRYLWGTPLICPRNVAAPSILKMKVLQYPGYAPSTNSTR